MGAFVVKRRTLREGVIFQRAEPVGKAPGMLLRASGSQSDDLFDYPTSFETSVKDDDCVTGDFEETEEEEGAGRGLRTTTVSRIR